MGLRIVGSGLGRTGTKSMQTALNMLGFGPCHHMIEVIQHPESIALWIEAAEGRPDWNAIFKDYCSMVDYPGAAYWRELVVFYPDAKVLHTQRDPDKWFDSTQATIFAPESIAFSDGPLAKFFRGFLGRLPENLHDRAAMTAYFRRHNEEVKATIAPERLLIFEVGEGWQRLCNFLGVPVPKEPFPSENSTADFIGRTLAAEIPKGTSS